MPRGRGWGKIVSDSGSTQAGITGIDIDHERDFRRIVKLTSGNFDDLRQPNTILLFESQIEKLHAKVGDAVIIVPDVDPALVTPLTEGFQAVLWHVIVSHPDLQMAAAKWESTK